MWSPLVTLNGFPVRAEVLLFVSYRDPPKSEASPERLFPSDVKSRAGGQPSGRHQGLGLCPAGLSPLLGRFAGWPAAGCVKATLAFHLAGCGERAGRGQLEGQKPEVVPESPREARA